MEGVPIGEGESIGRENRAMSMDQDLANPKESCNLSGMLSSSSAKAREPE